MLLKIAGTLIDTETVIFTTDIRESQHTLYWDIDNSQYVKECKYVFKIGFYTGDFLIMSNKDFKELTKIKNKIDNRLKESEE